MAYRGLLGVDDIYIFELSEIIMNDQRQRQMSSNPPHKPQSVHPQKYLLQPQPQSFHHNPPSSPLQKIHTELSQIDKITRQLHNVAQKIKSLGIMNAPNTNIPVLDQIQNDFHHALTQLIQNIREFYLDIDMKLKNLGVFVNTEFNRKGMGLTITGDEINTMIQETTDAKYQILAQRIKGLEISLRETQTNEKKLIQVIESMMQRYQIHDQPTLIRDSPGLQTQFKRNRIATTNPIMNVNVNTNSTSNIKYQEEQKSRRVSPMPVNNFMKPENKNKSIYENLYTIQESVVNQDVSTTSPPQHFRLRQIEEQDESSQVYIKRLYSKYPMPAYQNQSKKSLRGQSGDINPMMNSTHQSMNKQERSTASQASVVPDDKQHRFNFMLGKLNM